MNDVEADHEERLSPVEIPTRGRPLLDFSILNTAPAGEVGADDVFEKHDLITGALLEAGVGRWECVPAIEGSEFLVSIDLIDPNPNQSRQYFNPDELQSLQQSLQTHGQLETIKVGVYRDQKGQRRFALIDGERRWQALQNLNAPLIAVSIRRILTQERLQDDSDLGNFQRQGFTDVELAFIFERWRQKAIKTGIMGHAEQIAFIEANVSHRAKFIERHLRLVPLEPGLQDLVHKGIIKMSQAFLVEEVAEARGVGQTALAYKALGVTAASELGRLNSDEAWGRLSKARLQEAARIILHGGAGAVDDKRVSIRHTVGSLLESMGGFERYGERLIESHAEHPEAAADVLRHLHGTPLGRLREILRDMDERLAALQRVTDSLEEPIVSAPAHPEGFSLLGTIESNRNSLLSISERNRDAAAAQRRYYVLLELARAGDALNKMVTSSELAEILNTNHSVNPPLTPQGVGAILQKAQEALTSLNLVLDTDERHLRGPSGDFDWFTVYRLLTSAQKQAVDALRLQRVKSHRQIELSAETPKATEVVPAVVLPAKTREIVLYKLAAALLEQLELKGTRYNYEFLVYLLSVGEGVEKTSMDLYAYRGDDTPALRAKASQAFNLPQQLFAEKGLVDLVTPGHRVPRRFTLKPGVLPTLDQEALERALMEAAIDVAEEAGQPLTAAHVMAYFETFVKKSVFEILAELSKPIELSSPPTPESLPNAEVLGVVMHEVVSEILLHLGIRRTDYSRRLLSYLLERGEGVEWPTSDLYDAMGATERSERLLASHGMSSPLEQLAALGIVTITSGHAKVIKLLPNRLPLFEGTLKERISRRVVEGARDHLRPPFTLESLRSILSHHHSAVALIQTLRNQQAPLEPPAPAPAAPAPAPIATVEPAAVAPVAAPSPLVQAFISKYQLDSNESALFLELLAAGATGIEVADGDQKRTRLLSDLSGKIPNGALVMVPDKPNFWRLHETLLSRLLASSPPQSTAPAPRRPAPASPAARPAPPISAPPPMAASAPDKLTREEALLADAKHPSNPICDSTKFPFPFVALAMADVKRYRFLERRALKVYPTPDGPRERVQLLESLSAFGVSGRLGDKDTIVFYWNGKTGGRPHERMGVLILELSAPLIHLES